MDSTRIQIQSRSEQTAAVVLSEAVCAIYRWWEEQQLDSEPRQTESKLSQGLPAVVLSASLPVCDQTETLNDFNKYFIFSGSLFNTVCVNPCTDWPMHNGQPITAPQVQKTFRLQSTENQDLV